MIVLPLAIGWLAAILLAPFDGRRGRVGWAAVAALGALVAALVWLAARVLRAGTLSMVAGGWEAGVGIALRVDAAGVTFALLSAGVLLVALCYEVVNGVQSRTFPALVLFLAVGLTGLCLTGDAFNFYVFFEIAMVSAYVLTGYGESPRQMRSAFIFAVVNLLGSVLFLIAIASLYHVTGTLDMAAIAARAELVAPNSRILIAALLFVAFGVKLGLFPFHFWLPAVYTGTRPAVGAILSGALANIGSYGLLRFGGYLLPRELELGSIAVLGLGGASIVYGALQAISRRAPSEVLAYSSIGQVGYILIALAVGGPVGFAAVVLYAVVNSLNKTLLFLCAGVRGALVPTAFAVGAFSVAGVPPTAGFLGKLELFRVGVAEGSAPLVGLIFLGGALSFVYMFQIYQRAFWREHPTTAIIPHDRALSLLVAAVAGVVVALGVWPEPLLAVSRLAATALLVGGE